MEQRSPDLFGQLSPFKEIIHHLKQAKETFPSISPMANTAPGEGVALTPLWHSPRDCPVICFDYKCYEPLIELYQGKTSVKVHINPFRRDWIV